MCSNSYKCGCIYAEREGVPQCYCYANGPQGGIHVVCWGIILDRSIHDATDSKVYSEMCVTWLTLNE